VALAGNPSLIASRHLLRGSPLPKAY